MMNLAPSVTGRRCDSFPLTPREGKHTEHCDIAGANRASRGDCDQNILLITEPSTQNKQLNLKAHHGGL